MPEKNSLYKVSVNGFEFQFTKEQVEAVDLLVQSPESVHLVLDHRSVNAKLIEADRLAKKQTIEIDGENYFIEIKDELDQVLDQMGFGTVSSRHTREIKAPMPGLVLEISVSEGQQVFAGEKILILVAMKMENSIMIHADAKIKRVAVVAGQAVEKGQVLAELE